VPLQRRRHDGWTAEKQRMFLAALAATGAVGTAARLVGMTRKAAYETLENVALLKPLAVLGEGRRPM
jgi:molybdenum-dependent DNA-binding transcriptional regulator ModE